MTELETAQANLANLLAKIKSQEASLDEMTASSKALDSQGADQEAEKQKLQGEQTLALDRKQEIEKRISVLNSGSPVKDADAQAATAEENLAAVNKELATLSAALSKSGTDADAFSAKRAEESAKLDAATTFKAQLVTRSVNISNQIEKLQ